MSTATKIALATIADLVHDLPVDAHVRPSCSVPGDVWSTGILGGQRGAAGKFLTIGKVGQDRVMVVAVTDVVLTTETDASGKVWSLHGWQTTDGRCLAYRAA